MDGWMDGWIHLKDLETEIDIDIHIHSCSHTRTSAHCTAAMAGRWEIESS